MEDSRGRDGGGIALVAVAVVLLLALAIGAFFWFNMTIVRRRADVARMMAAEQEALQAASQAAIAAAESLALQGELDAPEEPVIAEASIRDMLEQQLTAWNAGDINAFMQHYWKSDDLTFSSGGNVTRGWQATLVRYKQRYPTTEAMGETSFANLEVSLLGPQAALVLGDWRLERESGVIGGKFSLVLRRIDGRWLIVHDHTSLGENVD